MNRNPHKLSLLEFKIGTKKEKLQNDNKKKKNLKNVDYWKKEQKTVEE